MKTDRFVEELYRGPGGIKALLTIATPIMISYGTETLMMFTDRLFLSRLGREHLSAGMSGSLTTFLCMSLFLGIVSYVNALVAQHYGAGKKAHCSKAATQGLIISLFSYPIMVFIAIQTKWLFIKSGHAPDVVELDPLCRAPVFAGVPHPVYDQRQHRPRRRRQSRRLPEA